MTLPVWFSIVLMVFAGFGFFAVSLVLEAAIDEYKSKPKHYRGVALRLYNERGVNQEILKDSAYVFKYLKIKNKTTEEFVDSGDTIRNLIDVVLECT